MLVSLTLVILGILFLESLQQRNIHRHDITLRRIAIEEMLVVLFGRVKSLQRHDLRDDRALEDFRVVQIANIRFGNFFLLFVGIKNRRPVVRAAIVMLPAIKPAASNGIATPKNNILFRIIISTLYIPGLPVLFRFHSL